MTRSADGVFDKFRITFGEGLTPTEQLLKHLGERSFLRFWSHANPRLTRNEELCDLLVVCGNFVIMFSDKSIDFQFDINEPIAWRRWYDKAIAKSVKQLNGAERRLIKLRNPVFKDRLCTVPIGIPLPSPDRVRIYRIAVVSFSEGQDFKAPPKPFIEIDGSVVGQLHESERAIPFKIGDVSPSSDFLHVIDLAGLWAILTTLDTITDFVHYLDARQAFIRGKPHNSAANEWCMLTRHLFGFTSTGDPVPLDAANPGYTRLTNDELRAESTKAGLSARKALNRISYVWDRLVSSQAEMLERQSFAFSTFSRVEDAERALRYMALETRLDRRTLGRAWLEACKISGPDQTANVRTVPHRGNGTPTYVFITVKKPDEMSDHEYHDQRRELAKKMLLASLVDVPTSTVIIGLASELGTEPTTHDFLHLEVADHVDTASLQADAQECWDFKKKYFADPKSTMVSERDIAS